MLDVGSDQALSGLMWPNVAGCRWPLAAIRLQMGYLCADDGPACRGGHRAPPMLMLVW
jgi:hypothetical protein